MTISVSRDGQTIIRVKPTENYLRAFRITSNGTPVDLSTWTSVTCVISKEFDRGDPLVILSLANGGLYADPDTVGECVLSFNIYRDQIETWPTGGYTFILAGEGPDGVREFRRGGFVVETGHDQSSPVYTVRDVSDVSSIAILQSRRNDLLRYWRFTRLGEPLDLSGAVFSLEIRPALDHPVLIANVAGGVTHEALLGSVRLLVFASHIAAWEIGAWHYSLAAYKLGRTIELARGPFVILP